MRAVVAAVSSNRSMSGVSRHAANLVKCLLTRPEVTSLHLLVGEWEQKYVNEAIGRRDSRLHLHVVPIGPGTLSRNLWYYRTLPAIASQLHADIVHIAYPSPIRRGAFACPVVVTLHDLYPYDIPSNFGFPRVIVNREILKECLRNANAIACVSDSTRVQLLKRMPQKVLKAVTVNNCVELAPIARRPSFVVQCPVRPFFLCIAQHRRNKNILLALRTFKCLLSQGSIRSDTMLVLIGMPGPETGRIESYIRTSGLNQCVVMTSGLSDAEINWCYRNCELLLAPSIVEGFRPDRGRPSGRMPDRLLGYPGIPKNGGPRLQVCDARTRLREGLRRGSHSLPCGASPVARPFGPIFGLPPCRTIHQALPDPDRWMEWCGHFFNCLGRQAG